MAAFVLVYCKGGNIVYVAVWRNPKDRKESAWMQARIDLEMLIHQQYQFWSDRVKEQMVEVGQVYDRARLDLIDHCYL